ncbi:MAG TPA: XdhC family protein, partial [Mucilaginibacter sp.]|nr:XdhC family protein [Mucilaginibacter sp.]
RARVAIQNSRSTLITYDTTEDDPYQIGVGLGCNGIIDVLFTPLDIHNKNNPVEILKKCTEAGRETHVLLTITGLTGNWHGIGEGMVVRYRDEASLRVFENEGLRSAIRDAVAEQVRTGHSAPHEFVTAEGGNVNLFIEILPPEIHMVLMGHQYDVYPMSKLIKEMGWRLTVVANPLKVNKLVAAIADEIAPPEKFAELIIDNYTAIILMAHDYKTDKYNLPKALATAAPYIGMLGPRVRSEKIWCELKAEGCDISPSDQERIYAPVGLDIGAVTPEEIALSLMAEVKAVLSGRDGTYLKLRQTAIHQST